MSKTLSDEELRAFFREHGIVGLHCAEEPECDPIEALGELIRNQTEAAVKVERKNTLRSRIRHLQMFLRYKRMFLGYSADDTLSTRKTIAKYRRELAALQSQEGDKTNE